MHITRPSDVFPEPILSEFRRLATFDETVTIHHAPSGEGFYSEFTHKTWMTRYCKIGSDIMAAEASIAWIRQGPKIVHVSEEQAAAMRLVDVRLELKDFSMPYHTVLVSLPPGGLHRACLVHRYNENVLVFQQISEGNVNDIATVVRHHDGKMVEESLERYDECLQDVAEESCCTLRIAANMMLAMSSYGCHSQYLFPSEVEREMKFVAKGDRPGRGGRRASDRLREAPILLTLDRTVKLARYRGEDGEEAAGAEMGREMPFHQRRGHWAMQPCGPGGSQRKRILRPPTMVRPDRLAGPLSAITTTYR